LSSVLGPGQLKSAFYSWISSLGLTRKSGLVQTGSIGCHYSGHRFGRIFLAGDAAGLASPLTGEGIAQAIISGREVAEEIINPDYRSSTVARLGARHLRTSRALAIKSIHGTLYPLAPYLLKIPKVAQETLRRYVM
jgi:geranylgeranyl reductase